MKNYSKLPRVAAVMRAIKEEHTSDRFVGFGWCLHCGTKVTGVEPDAHEYHCDKCGQDEVHGAEDIFISGYFRE